MQNMHEVMRCNWRATQRFVQALKSPQSAGFLCGVFASGQVGEGRSLARLAILAAAASGQKNRNKSQ